MKIPPGVVFSVFLFLLPPAVLAQSRPGSGGGGSGAGGGSPNMPASNPMPTAPSFPSDIDRPLFISGKVVLPDGSPVSEPVSIESICGGRKRIETYSDSRGGFSFQMKRKSDNATIQPADISLSGDDGFSRGDGSGFQNCELTAVLSGFISESVLLATKVSSLAQSADVGRIVIRPIGGSSETVLSVTSLAAPNSAKKAMDKAREQEKKNKIPEAEQSLQKAVDIYPKYAAAWAELGQLQSANHQDADAKHSFEQAIAADPRYTRPYLGLTDLAIRAADWKNALDLTGKLLDLNSNDPVAWLLRAVSQFNLHDFDGAEASARNGLKADPQHTVPKLEHVLGVLLANKQDFVQSAEHLRAFLKYDTQPLDRAEGQKLLAEIEKRSDQAQLTASPAAAPEPAPEEKK